MDADDAELIRQLCTRAGMLMEDASARAVLMLASSAEAELPSLLRDAESATALLKAAGTLI